MLGRDDHPGIMAHALTELFTEMRRTKDDHVYNVTMSYLEVHSPLLSDSASNQRPVYERHRARVLHDIVNRLVT